MFDKRIILGFLLIASCYGQYPMEGYHIEVEPKVTGGTNALLGQFPSSVAIFTPSSNAPICNGVILNQNHILTSAKCLHGENRAVINPFWLRIVAGDLNAYVASYGRMTINITHVFIHPHYSPTQNDIAVLRTGIPFPSPHNTIDTAIINERVVAIQTQCVYGGWGASSLTGNVDPLQKRLNVPILDRNLCNAQNVHNGRVLESMICGGSITSTVPAVGVCTGNLGGGLFCNEQLTGILSFGMGCGTPNSPGVYTQVRFYRNWINSVFTSNNATLPGTIV